MSSVERLTTMVRNHSLLEVGYRTSATNMGYLVARLSESITSIAYDVDDVSGFVVSEVAVVAD